MNIEDRTKARQDCIAAVLKTKTVYWLLEDLLKDAQAVYDWIEDKQGGTLDGFYDAATPTGLSAAEMPGGSR